MKANKLFLGLATIAAAVFSFSSCSQDELSTAKAETPDLGQEILLSTNFSTTRSVAQDIQTGTQILSGVQVGVFVATNESTTSFVENGTNKAYTADGNGGLTAVDTENKVYYPKTGSVDIYAYAPYQSSWNDTDVNANQDFTVQADQSSETNYLASDLIWATPQTNKSSTTENLALPFAHKLSKININIVNNRTGLSLKGATVSILNTVRTATINPSTGTTAVKDGESASAITVATYGTDSEPTATAQSPATASAIIVPQEIAANTKFIQVITSADQNNNESTTLTAKIGTSNKTFASNKRYNYTLTINDNSVELTFNGTSLGSWEDENESGDLEDETTYTIGDYVLNDGTFLKASALASASDETKNKISAVIFSTTKHGTDWDGYAVSVCGAKGSQTWQSGTNIEASILGGGSAIESITDAVNDFTGLTVTTAAQNANYESAFSFTAYKNQSTAKNISGTNISDWFMPSFGQMIELFKTLGGASSLDLSTISWKSTGDQGEPTDETRPTGRATIISNINSHKVGDTDIISNLDYCTTTQKSTTQMWVVKLSVSDSDYWSVSRTATKTNGGRNVLPILAFKFPTNE